MSRGQASSAVIPGARHTQQGVAPAFRLRLRALDGEADPQAEADDPHALKLFARAARLSPHDPDYHYILGRALLRDRRFSEAAAVCREAVQLDPHNPDYHHALGAALWGLEHNEDAEAAFREAVRLRPGDPASLNALGCALTRLGRQREAVAVYHKALEHAESEADIRGNLGVVLWAHGRTAGALRAFREAVRLAPHDGELKRNLALALGGLGRHDEALRLFDELARSRPSRADAHLDRAEALHALGRDAEVDKAIDEALRLDAMALAARPHIGEMLDARRLKRLVEELARDRPPAGSELASRVIFAVGDAAGGLAAVRRRASGLLLVAGLALAAYGTWRAAPPHVARYLLQDDIAGIAGAPVREDADVLDRLMHAVHERGLSAHVRESNFEIRTSAKWRRIICRYEVPVEILPGLVHTFRFHIETERPYIVEPDPKFL
jgi:Flp pilus assembly protein TadD